MNFLKVSALIKYLEKLVKIGFHAISHALNESFEVLKWTFVLVFILMFYEIEVFEESNSW
jgi:hypothetical protein